MCFPNDSRSAEEAREERGLARPTCVIWKAHILNRRIRTMKKVIHTEATLFAYTLFELCTTIYKYVGGTVSCCIL